MSCLHHLSSLRLASLLLLAALVAPLAASSRDARAEIWDWESSPNYQFRMWIDDGQDVVYGFYVIFNESAGDTRDLATRERYVDWARTMGFGIIGTRFEAPDNSDEDTQQSATLLTALDNFAGMSGHPEVANAPLLVDGLSLGGHNAIKFAAIYPERTIGYLGGGARRMPEEISNPDLARVPGLFYHGEFDTEIDDANARRDEFLTMRAAGHEAAFFVQWGFGHERGHANRMGWKILSDMVSLRYPSDQSPLDGPITLREIPIEDGWLANPDSWTDGITATEPYEGATQVGSKFWLPTRDAAYVYLAHATRDSALTFLSPAGPEQYESVEPGTSVDIEISTGDLGDVAMVEVFDGSQSIAQMTAPPYTATWTAEGIGMHALVAIATLGNGTQRTGNSAPLMVLGTTRPGGGSSGDGGDDGSTGDTGDDGTGDDGDGSDDGTGDDGDGSDDNGADGMGGDRSDGGCGCRAGQDGETSPIGGLVLAAGAVMVATRTRRRRAGR